MQPAERALDASIKIENRPHGPRGELFESGVPIRPEAALNMGGRVCYSLAGWNTRNGNTFAHLMPLGQRELKRLFRVALIGLDGNGGEAVMSPRCGLGLHRIVPFILNGFLHGLEAEQFGKNLG